MREYFFGWNSHRRVELRIALSNVFVGMSQLMFLLFPLFYALHQFVELEQNLSDLDAAAMTGIYLLLLYLLFTAPS